MLKKCEAVIVILVLVSAGLWAGTTPDRALQKSGSFSSAFPFQATSTQIVAGPDFTTTFTFRNGGATSCFFFVDYHKGAGQVPSIPLLTNGVDRGVQFSDEVPPNGVKELVLTTPNAVSETFEGAATFELFSPNCARSVKVLTSYEVRAGGQLQELFSYGTPHPMALGTCGVAPVNFDPDGSDGRIRIPGLATVGFQPLTGIQLCMDLLDDQGNSIAPEQCSDYDGVHQTTLLTQSFPGQDDPFTGAWRVCLEGDKPPQQVEPTAIQALFIDVLQEGTKVQFGTRDHTIENPSCVTGPTTSCLLDNRFKVEVDWTSFTGSGPGQVGRSTDNSTLFFFGADSELLVNLLDACSTNSNHFWVFYGATTDVEYTLRVTDTQTNDVQTYSNPLGQPAPPVLDTTAFATCP